MMRKNANRAPTDTRVKHVCASSCVLRDRDKRIGEGDFFVTAEGFDERCIRLRGTMVRVNEMTVFPVGKNYRRTWVLSENHYVIINVTAFVRVVYLLQDSWDLFFVSSRKSDGAKHDLVHRGTTAEHVCAIDFSAKTLTNFKTSTSAR